jgi:tetratricopeptide (TPR) repeat protein
LALFLFIAINLNGLRSAWYADLGAMQMAKTELIGFPTNEWTDPAIATEFEEAGTLLRSALDADPLNRTADHRLGLISMLQGDFLSAASYLEKAYAAAPDHRGIIKSLGYCYVWLGDREKALLLLREIPEAKDELDVYVWWWDTQGRHDLSVNATRQLAYLKTQKDQP